MTTTTTLETLRIVRLAMFQLRQDVGVPDTVEAAAADTSMPWTKCRDAFEVAFAEVLDAHNWTWKRGVTIPTRTGTENPPIPPTVLEAPDDWPADAKNALVYCLAAELAVPVAGRVEDMKNCRAIYGQKLHDARVHDLDLELAAVTDPETREILSLVCPTITTGGAALPMDLLAVTRRIDANSDRARDEILAAHNWSFARMEWQVNSCGCDPDSDGLYHFSAPLPPKCARLLECYGHCGSRADWKIVGQTIKSVEPIEKLIYLRQIDDVSKLPPLLRSAYVSLIAADIAATVAGSSAEANRLRAVYERNLESAKLADSRSTGSRREVYGRNFYADAMTRGNGESAYAFGYGATGGERGGRPWRF